MKATQFHATFGENADFWGEDTEFSVSEWQSEVSDDDTRLGYWDWALSQREQRQQDEE